MILTILILTIINTISLVLFTTAIFQVGRVVVRLAKESGLKTK